MHWLMAMSRIETCKKVASDFGLVGGLPRKWRPVSFTLNNWIAVMTNKVPHSTDEFDLPKCGHC